MPGCQVGLRGCECRLRTGEGGGGDKVQTLTKNRCQYIFQGQWKGGGGSEVRLGARLSGLPVKLSEQALGTDNQRAGWGGGCSKTNRREWLVGGTPRWCSACVPQAVTSKMPPAQVSCCCHARTQLLPPPASSNALSASSPLQTPVLTPVPPPRTTPCNTTTPFLRMLASCTV